MDEIPSKSQKKRDADAFKDLVLQLSTLSDLQLKQFSLQPEALEALKAYQSTSALVAKKRALYRAAKVIKDRYQIAPLRKIYNTIYHNVTLDATNFQKMEHWRQRLITEGVAAWEAFILAYPAAHTAEYKDLVHQAQCEAMQGEKKVASKKLFKYLAALSS